MVDFPPQIMFPNGNKIVLDKTRLLLVIKSPSTMNAMAIKLLSSPFKLEDPGNPPEPINHLKTRFWIQKSGEYNDDDIIVLNTEFGQDLDWLGPVYSNPDVPGRRGLMCPLPNVLIITLTSQASGNEQQISQNLDNNFTMKRSLEKSTYSGLNTHYYVIQDTQNFNAYQVKSNLEPDTATYDSFRFELMPLIVPLTLIPNDVQFNNQWNMTRIKAGGVGTTAWDLTTGSEEVVICVMDSGCNLAHPDLIPYASSGVNLDTMIADGSPVEPPGPANLIGHGTAVAGIIAAKINNLLTIAGVAGKCKILPLALVAWSTEELVRGINIAASFKANVINMSLTTNNPDTAAMEQALEIASKNALICACTGNENKSTVSYPARSKYVMACGASENDINGNDNRQSLVSPTLWTAPLIGSNFGPEMSVVAPGIGIPTTDIVGSGGFNPSGDFTLGFQGTSAAVPHLSGLAGLIFSVFPDISPDEVRYIIERTADKVGILPYATDQGHPNGTWNTEMGYGRINALRAVLAAASFNPDSPWYREVVFVGTMVLHDYEPEPLVDDDEKTSVFSVSGIPTTYQLGPFQTHVELPVWIDKVGGEIRGEVRLTLDWKNDSSVDVGYNIKLYEGTSEETTDLDGEKSGSLNVKKDTTGFLDDTVLNTDESSNDFIKLGMTIQNNKRP